MSSPTDQRSPFELPSNPETLVDEQGVADYYDVERSTIRTWRYEGRGPRYILVAGNVVRYRVGDLLDHNASRSAFSTTEEREARV